MHSSGIFQLNRTSMNSKGQKCGERFLHNILPAAKTSTHTGFNHGFCPRGPRACPAIFFSTRGIWVEVIITMRRRFHISVANMVFQLAVLCGAGLKLVFEDIICSGKSRCHVTNSYPVWDQ